jgi:hypothetical protein
MGFWNKLKQGITQMTGGGGNMQLQLASTQVKRGENLNATITLNCTSQLSGKSINLEVMGVETVKYQVPVLSTSTTTTAQGTSTTTEMQEETKDNQTYHSSVVVDPNPVQMNQGESKQWAASIAIPANVPPAYTGTDAKHVWHVRAYLEVPMGADIDADAEFIVL